MVTKEEITSWFKELQQSICISLEKTDGKAKFIEDNWTRDEGGGGITKVIEHGRILEKGAVNFSAVHGTLSPLMQKSLGIESDYFYATGVSIIMHPVNPMVPIIHMNVRYFETTENHFWFGGGIDLTPHYINKSDARFFHQQLKSVCDTFNSDYYNKFKKWADDYFFIKHRNETRGIGGIFFDRLTGKNSAEKDNLFEFIKAVGSCFAPTYTALMKSNFEKKFGEQEKEWQYLRRGRYVEFNLVYDQGTKFGLETNGRIESILLSLPPEVKWKYNHQPLIHSAEKETLDLLKKNIDWFAS